MANLGGIIKPVTDLTKSKKAGKIKAIKLKVKFDTAAQSAQKPFNGTSPK